MIEKKSIPAGEIERFVVEQIKCIGKDPALLNETFAEARAQASTRLAELDVERKNSQRELRRWNAEVRKLAGDAGTSTLARLADLQERIRGAERRMTKINEQNIALSQDLVEESEVALALSNFEPVWDSLTPREQGRIVQLLVEPFVGQPIWRNSTISTVGWSSKWRRCPRRGAAW